MELWGWGGVTSANGNYAIRIPNNKIGVSPVHLRFEANKLILYIPERDEPAIVFALHQLAAKEVDNPDVLSTVFGVVLHD